MRPVEELIPREADPGIRGVLDKFGGGIAEVANFGSHILDWDSHSKNQGGDHNAAILLLFRHYLELIDSISILVKHSSIDPCKLILRGALETYFGFEYIFEKDSNERAMAFLVCHTHKKLRTYRNLDHGSKENATFLTEISKDKSFDTLDLSRIPRIDEAIKNSESMLRLDQYQNAEREYQRLVGLKIKNPHWYQFWDGPKNVKELSSHLKLNGLYEILYRYWSGSTHSTDVIDGKLYNAGDGLAQIIQIRFAKDAQSITSYSMSISFRLFELYIKNRIPTKHSDYLVWYSTVRDLFLKIASKERIIQIQ